MELHLLDEAAEFGEQVDEGMAGSREPGRGAKEDWQQDSSQWGARVAW